MNQRLSLAISLLPWAVISAEAFAQKCDPAADIGFLKTYPNLGGWLDNRITTPVVGDVDGTGEQKIFFLRDQFLHGLSADGGELPNFPVDLAALAGVQADVLDNPWTLSLADFTQDGHQQLVAFVPLLHPRPAVLFVLNGDGTVFNSWPATGVTLSTIVDGSPTIADLDGDGIPEIIVGSGDVPSGGRLFVFNANGMPLNEHFPITLAGYHVGSTPAVADLDGDGRQDILFVGGDYHVHAIQAQDGLELPGWPIPISGFRTSVAVGDLNRDGQLEVVVAEEGKRLSVFRSDGSLLPGWPVALNTLLMSPALANVDDAPDLEIIVTTLRQVYVFKADGSVVPGWPQFFDGFSEFATNVTVADLDGSGTRALSFLSSYGDWYIWNSTGSLFPGFPRHFAEPDKATNSFSTPVIADLHGNGHLAALFGLSFFGGFTDPPSSFFARFYVEDLHVCSSLNDGDWLTFHRDNQRTGRAQ